MTKKWVQAENLADEKLDVWVQVEVPDAAGVAETGVAERGSVLLGKNGRPLRSRHPVGFDPRRAS